MLRYITKRLYEITPPIKSPNYTNTISDTYSTNTVKLSAICSLKNEAKALIPKIRPTMAEIRITLLTISHTSPLWTTKPTNLDMP